MGKKNYSIVQKMKLIIAYDSLKEEERGAFLRSRGLYDKDILKWKSEIVELSDAQPVSKLTRQPNKDLSADLKRTKKMLDQKNGELKKKERELREAKAIIELKKKAEILFGSEDEE
jgi:hypothetical protein